MPPADGGSPDEPVTLVAGATMCISSPDGGIRPDSREGIYHRDVRLVSALALTVDGSAPPLAAAAREGANRSHRIHTLATDAHESPTAVLRCRRDVGVDVTDTYTVEVYAGVLHGVELRLELASDFSDLLARKYALAAPPPTAYARGGGGLAADAERFGVVIAPTGPAPRVEDGALVWTVDAAPGRPWRAGVRVQPRDGGEPVAVRRGPAALDRDEPVAPDGGRTASDGERQEAGGGQALRSPLRVAAVAEAWPATTASALADLDGLRISAPDLGLSYLGAGAPWFMALFGRDTLLTGWSSLIAGTDLALDVLEALAAHQGRSHDARTLEQPGRILHELRTGGSGVFGLESGRAYYGTADASPLFVMLLAEVARFGGDPRRVTALLPAARAAVAWCVDFGDLDGDGYVEYAADPKGLANQGWKDSGDAMVHADGSLAPAPIALAEVQGYLHGAYLALAELEQRSGEPERAPALRQRAGALRSAFLRDFWLPEHDLVAMALDADKRPLVVASSNMAHCLWTGLVDGERARTLAARLGAADLATSWGLRTLGSGEVAYNPLGYHLGSIWPHDTAIAAAGLARAGDRAGALRLTEGLLAAARHFDWRLPELFGGLDAGDLPFPVPYPVACSPQAWSAAAPLLLLRTALGLEPDVGAGVVRIDPNLGEGVELHVAGIPLGGGTLELRARGRHAEVLAAPPGLRVEVA